MAVLLLDRLTMIAPVEWTEPVGDEVATVGSTPVPGDRSDRSAEVTLQSIAATADSTSERQRIRNQYRSLVNNRARVMAGVYLAWDDDPEQDGWYVPAKGAMEFINQAITNRAVKMSSSFVLVGRSRTHRSGVEAYLRDRRVSTEPRDFRRRIYSTDFSGMTPSGLVWLPSTISDPTLNSFASLSLTGARAGYGSSSVQAAIGPANGSVITFEQADAVRHLGDVVIYDRRGTITGPSAGPDAAWHEVYGPDWQCASGSDWRSGTDAPVLDNSLVRVRFSSTNTDGFVVDRWSGSAWVEVGKILIERVGTATAYCDTLVSAEVVEWSPHRAVVHCVMKVAADAFSREDVYLTLQRGWNGPRVEVYPAPKTGGAAAGAGVHLFRFDAPAGTETAQKFDGSLQTVTGVPNFTPGNVGAATFSGENWIVMWRTTVNALALAGLQAGATGRVEAGTNAYGSARNGISIRSSASATYVSAQVGMNTATTSSPAVDSVNGQLDGARDLGKDVLYDSRSPQTIVSR